jgi:hypothetical protein
MDLVAGQKNRNIRREESRFNGLPVRTDWGGEGDYLPRILPLASKVAFPNVVVGTQGLKIS